MLELDSKGFASSVKSMLPIFPFKGVPAFALRFNRVFGLGVN